MASDGSRELTSATFGSGVVAPQEYAALWSGEPTVAIVYRDQDLSVVVWNLEPGEQNSTHRHDANAHTIMVLQGNGLYLRDEEPVPIRAGECILVPRGTTHGIRNTGTGRLSYLAVTTEGSTGYQRTALGASPGH